MDIYIFINSFVVAFLAMQWWRQRRMNNLQSKMMDLLQDMIELESKAIKTIYRRIDEGGIAP